MTVLPPVYPQPTCDGGGWVIRVTDRPGTVRQYWAGQFVSNCQEVALAQLPQFWGYASTISMG
jgi:hypothetical protein